MRAATGLLAVLLASGAWAAGEAAPGASSAPSSPREPSQGPESEPPRLSPEQSEALLRLPGGLYESGADERVIDTRTGRPVTPEEATLALMRALSSSPESRDAVLPVLVAQHRLAHPNLTEPEAAAAVERIARLSAPNARLAASGERALTLGTPGFGEARSPEEPQPGTPGSAALRRARDASALPRAQLPASLRKSGQPARPSTAQQTAGLKEDIHTLFTEFNTNLPKAGAPALGQGWVGNLLYGYRCQNMHDGFKTVIERRGWDKKYPDLEMVGLYQPGPYRLNRGIGNHIFIGVIDKRSGRVTHYFDPWGNLEMRPYTGMDDLPLSRDSLEVRPWNGGGSYNVDDQGRRIR